MGADFRQLKHFSERLNLLNSKHFRRFIEGVARELTTRLLGKTIPRTPVDTGTLRRGWTAKTYEEAKAGGESDYVKYANSLPVTKQGNNYVIKIINPVEYASYVEFGHRTRNGKGWVEGRFMLTKSEMELDGELDKIIEEKMLRFFEQLFK